MNTILFDLDGTLLPLNMDAFMSIYFREMALTFDGIVDTKELIDNIWSSTNVMVNNKDYKTNEDVFMNDFSKRIKGNVEDFKKIFDEFYDNGFMKVKESVYDIPWIKKSINVLKEKGYDLVVATNPLFPFKAIKHRINWAGFDTSDFIYISCYEKNHYCKPQIEFYKEVLENIVRKPEECLMVGNDVQEDMVAGTIGMKTYLIKDFILHRNGENINADYIGDYRDFYNFVESLPSLK